MPAPRLLVVSNRAPVELVREGDALRPRRTVGGLATALDAVMRARGGLWVAWAGTEERELLEGSRTGLGYPILAVPLDEEDLELYYSGFANQVLWPLCHMFSTRCRFDAGFWTAYERVNERFALVTASVAQANDVVWVNDFHCCLVPGRLRALGVTSRIGLFWHIPFPPPSIFGICQWREELLLGLLGADLLGFQTPDDVRQFGECVRQLLGAPIEDDALGLRLRIGDRIVHAAALPIGIDAARFEAQARDPAVLGEVQRLRQAIGAEVLMIAVDRLDYTKGIVERLYGFERFLERRPDWHRRVCLLQITVPSRFHVPQYRELKREIDESVGRIVGRFTVDARAPLVYSYNAYDHEQLTAHYAAADVALVTPLRDGMNLVAKEYVACHPSGDGVLVLSEFAGAAHELREAVLVNPYEREAIADAIETALDMPEAERRRRMCALAARVRAHDLQWWTSSFLGLLAGDPAPVRRLAPQATV